MSGATHDPSDLAQFIEDVPDFPSPGITFRDLTPLLADPQGLARSVDALAEAVRSSAGEVDRVLGMEARGFLFGPAVALRLGVGFVPVRKPGKLPRAVVTETYDLEYGTDSLQIHHDSVRAGERVVVVDDVIATGGTAAATARLVTGLGAEVAGFAFLVELDALDGRSRLDGAPVVSLIRY